jgi:general L-amino acid transport system permease protein
MSTDLPAGLAPARVAFYNDPKVRSLAYQVALCAVIGFLVYAAVSNAITNLERAHIASGFGFWHNNAGFDISQTLIPYDSESSSYGRAFWVGLLNTLLVASLGIVIATVLGFVVGIARLSKNWLVSKAATGYVETIRNIPLLLQLLFWYNAVLKALPEMHDSFKIPGGIFLNNRGLFVPQPIYGHGFAWVEIACAAGIVGSIGYYVWARKRQEHTGQQAPVALVALALVIGLPLAIFALAGFPLSFEFPQGGRFNINGGVEILPEFAALLFGLSIYTAAFIAEVVRAGILAVSGGQTEAAYSLGLRAAGDARDYSAADQPIS